MMKKMTFKSCTDKVRKVVRMMLVCSKSGGGKKYLEIINDTDSILISKTGVETANKFKSAI